MALYQGDIERLKYSDPSATLLCGDTREALNEVEPRSVDMVMTSPPYYGLRKYDGEPQIWDNHKGCEHEWGLGLPEHHKGQVEQTKWKTAQAAGYGQTAKSGQFCSLCGAWRGQLGLEPTPELYIKHLCDIFDQVRGVMRHTATLWVNIDDSYWNAKGSCFNPGGGNASWKSWNKKKWAYPLKRGNKSDNPDIPQKSLIGIPERFVLEMMNRGWIRRNTIIWHKKNPMPESVKDRFTVDFEYLYMFSLKKKYYFEQQFEPMREPERIFNPDVSSHKSANMKAEGNRTTGGLHDGRTQYGNPELGRNKRCVWDISTRSFPGAHFAVFTEALCETPVKAGCPIGGIVLDPFSGTGTTVAVAKRLGRRGIGIEQSKKYHKMAIKRIETVNAPLLSEV